MRSTEKKYYKIKEVSEMLDIPISTLHFWERQFTVLSPRRSRGMIGCIRPTILKKSRWCIIL